MSSGLLVPVRFAAADPDLEVTVGATTETLTLNVEADRDYWLAGDDTADSSAGNGDLVALFEAMLNTHTGSADFVVTLNASKQLVVDNTSGGDNFILDWDAGGSTLAAATFGFTGSTSSALTTTSPDPVHGWWLPGADLRDDTRERQVPLRARRQAMTGAVKVTDFGESTKTREVSWQWLQQSVILTEYEAVTNGAFEHWWVEYISKGERTRLYEDVGASAFDTYRIADVGGNPMSRNEEFPTRWDVRLRWRSST